MNLDMDFFQIGLANNRMQYQIPICDDYKNIKFSNCSVFTHFSKFKIESLIIVMALL